MINAFKVKANNDNIINDDDNDDDNDVDNKNDVDNNNDHIDDDDKTCLLLTIASDKKAELQHM